MSKLIELTTKNETNTSDIKPYFDDIKMLFSFIIIICILYTGVMVVVSFHPEWGWKETTYNNTLICRSYDNKSLLIFVDNKIANGKWQWSIRQNGIVILSGEGDNPNDAKNKAKDVYKKIF